MTSELRRLVHELCIQFGIDCPVLWYYTPMALEFTRDMPADAIVFDCMDELSAFHGAPPELVALEAELLTRADLVFTGGQSLFEAKRHRHRRVFAFPSSVDVAHFARARECRREPGDQAGLPRPRIGFFGVIDERLDLPLVGAIAESRPDWQIVMLGPCAKIDPSTLPRPRNIHYLGIKQYAELPDYLSGWDVAILPFARNESTRFISPTKTPEYLAAGRPVVSTSIRDVVRPYGDQQLVSIADEASEFVAAIAQSLSGKPEGWRERVDKFLGDLSWDRTWSEMSHLIDTVGRAPRTYADRRAVAMQPGFGGGRGRAGAYPQP